MYTGASKYSTFVLIKRPLRNWIMLISVSIFVAKQCGGVKQPIPIISSLQIQMQSCVYAYIGYCHAIHVNYLHANVYIYISKLKNRKICIDNIICYDGFGFKSDHTRCSIFFFWNNGVLWHVTWCFTVCNLMSWFVLQYIVTVI